MQRTGNSKATKECLLTEEWMNIMKENFDRLDKHGDLIVSRQKLVHEIMIDPRIRKY